VIVFNGEIHNHEALRHELLNAGHVFRNRCDTEAIIHAWESWGPDCLQHLSGMFAFALWDRNREILFLARDRLGKKPLYYAEGRDGRFLLRLRVRRLCRYTAGYRVALTRSRSKIFYLRLHIP
jgi:asparagine synthase (glutamine-hydrolysing)